MKKNDSILYFWRRLPLLALLLGVVFTFMLVVPAWAATTTTTNIPVALHIFDPCAGEGITFSGTAQVVSTTTINGNTAFVQQHIVIHATGTGDTSHSTYILNKESSEQLHLQVGLVHTEYSISTIIGPGGGQKGQLQIFFHTTVNANGTVTVAIFDDKVICP